MMVSLTLTPTNAHTHTAPEEPHEEPAEEATQHYNDDHNNSNDGAAEGDDYDEEDDAPPPTRPVPTPAPGRPALPAPPRAPGPAPPGRQASNGASTTEPHIHTHTRSGSCIGTNAWTRVQCLVGRSTPTASSRRLLRSATYPRTTQAAAMAAFCACRQRRDQRCHRLPSRQCPLLPSHRFAQTAKLDRLHDQVLPHTRTQLTHTHVTDAFS